MKRVTATYHVTHVVPGAKLRLPVLNKPTAKEDIILTVLCLSVGYFLVRICLGV
jgi:hypothetical protein